MDMKSVVKANIRRLLGVAEGESATQKLIRLGLANGTAQRLLDDTSDVRLGTLVQVADALKVAPWQLLVEDLDPDSLPMLQPSHFRWPFRAISPETITGLVGTQAAQVEAGLLVALAAVGIGPRTDLLHLKPHMKRSDAA